MRRGKTGQCMNYKLTKENVREAIFKNPKFSFLKKIVEDIPEAPEVETTVTYCGTKLSLDRPNRNTGALIGKRSSAHDYDQPYKKQRISNGDSDSDQNDYVYTGGLSYMNAGDHKFEDEPSSKQE